MNRGRTGSSSKPGTKAGREKLRREQLNDKYVQSFASCVCFFRYCLHFVVLQSLMKKKNRMFFRFMDLSSVLEPKRTPKTDKSAIIDDAIRAVKQLRGEAHELKETNQKLLEEIKSLKVGFSLCLSDYNLIAPLMKLSH